MKKIAILVMLIVFATGCTENVPAETNDQDSLLPDDLTKEEQALLSDTRQMFQKRDVSVMLDRVYKKGIENWWIQLEKKYLQSTLEDGLDRLELVRINPPIKKETQVNGSVVEWNLPLKWKLIIHHPEDANGMRIRHTIPLSDHEGRLVIIRCESKQGSNNAH